MSIKRENDNVIISASTLVLDIEGTTSSISFVKDELFPYVRKHLEPFVNKNWDSSDFQKIVNALKAQAKEDEEKKVEGVIVIPESEEKDTLVKAVVDNVVWQMDNDRKTKSLKDLQGMIMEEGFMKGELKGHVYDDVEPSLKSWTEQDKTVYIYSSGSVHAQKLLFGHSEKGDLLPFIKGHFDTTVGMKSEVASYEKILSEISCSASEVVFLTDIIKEARAAKEAGISAIILSRKGNSPLTEDEKLEFPIITSFEEIEFNHASKKRKICDDNDVKKENKPFTTCAVSNSKPNDPELTTNNDPEMMEVDPIEDTSTIGSKKNTSLVEVKEENKNCGTTKQIDVNGVCNVPVESNCIENVEDICKNEVDNKTNEIEPTDIDPTKVKENKQIDTVDDCKGNETIVNADIIINKTETNDNHARDSKSNAETNIKNNEESVKNIIPVSDEVIIKKKPEEEKEIKEISEVSITCVANQNHEKAVLKDDNPVQISKCDTDIQDKKEIEIKGNNTVTVDNSTVIDSHSENTKVAPNSSNDMSVGCEKFSDADKVETETDKPALSKEKGLTVEASTEISNVSVSEEVGKAKVAAKHLSPSIIQEKTKISEINESETQSIPAVKNCNVLEESMSKKRDVSQEKEISEKNVPEEIVENSSEINDMLPGTEAISEVKEKLDVCELDTLNHVASKELTSIQKLERDNQDKTSKKCETICERTEEPQQIPEKLNVPVEVCDTTTINKTETSETSKIETNGIIDIPETKLPTNKTDVLSIKKSEEIDESTSQCNNGKLQEFQTLNDTLQNGKVTSSDSVEQSIKSISSPNPEKMTLSADNVNGTSSCHEKKCDASEKSLETVVEA